MSYLVKLSKERFGIGFGIFHVSEGCGKPNTNKLKQGLVVVKFTSRALLPPIRLGG